MKSTIKDVATKANVSIATVSRVINNLSGYSKDTEEKVLKVIKELNYQPNDIARGLINKRTHTIGILVPEVSSMLSSQILRGVELFSHGNNYSVFICHIDVNGSRMEKYLQLLREKRVDGVIITSERITESYYQVLKNFDAPIVLISTISEYSIPYVKVDDKQAAYDATKYLILKGHRKIAMISGTKNDEIAGVPRVEGYKAALRDYNIQVHDNYLAYGKFDYHSGIKAMEDLLETAPDITAVFASSDEMAAAVMSVAYKLGIKIPDQLSVIGYDNTKIAEMTTPPLTVVAQPLKEIGERAAEMLFTMIEGGDTVQSQLMQHTIIERSTVKKM